MTIKNASNWRGLSPDLRELASNLAHMYQDEMDSSHQPGTTSDPVSDAPLPTCTDVVDLTVVKRLTQWPGRESCAGTFPQGSEHSRVSDDGPGPASLRLTLVISLGILGPRAVDVQ